MLGKPQYKSGDQTVFVRVNVDVDSYVSESDDESQVSVESLDVGVELVDDINALMRAKFLANKACLDQLVRTWEFLDSDQQMSAGIKIVKAPTASKIQHVVLNPYLYRGLQPINSLNNLASLVGAPIDWYQIYELKVASDHLVKRLYRKLVSLDENVSENDIQNAFESLVIRIGTCLGISVQYSQQKSYIVGGILANSEYDIRGRLDSVFNGWSGNSLLATECKRASAFLPDKMWHHGSRGVQTLSTLFVTGCPTILYSQKAFKIFLENDSRDTIYTWTTSCFNESSDNSVPYSREMIASSYGIENMTSVILQVISMCLLACGRDDLDSSVVEAEELMTTEESSFAKCSDVLLSGQQVGKASAEGRSGAQKVARSQILKIIQPQFMSGFVNGTPSYIAVRIAPDDLVNKIETLTQKSA
ncbi:hypothetical protein MIR68_000757 [Amoeboaphelidium protococcarum]|nr:hypothetical protein MIR68_000757 [Amoeboaphelidium protococcarum]